MLSAVSVLSIAASAATAAPAVAVTKSPAKKKVMHVRAYDHQLLVDVNKARAAKHRPALHMSNRLWQIAHTYAAHMAKTGDLEHNPKVFPQINRSCPKFTAAEENVGMDPDTDSLGLFNAYMHSTSHRENIMDSEVTDVGIASVQATRDGMTIQYNVMDFANHCS